MTQSSDASLVAGPSRFHALDSVRATAMMLGIVYHALLFGGGIAGMFGGGSAGGNVVLMTWIHSFRMALFFLVGGFFSAMMFGKYPLRKYLGRRWWRLGAAMVIYLFALLVINRLTGYQGGFPGGPGGGDRDRDRLSRGAMSPMQPPRASGIPGPASFGQDGLARAAADGSESVAGPGGPQVNAGPRGPGAAGNPGFRPEDFGPGMLIAGAVVEQADGDRDRRVTGAEWGVLAGAWFDKLDPAKSGVVAPSVFVERFGELLPRLQGGGGPPAGAGGFNPARFVAPGLFGALDSDRDGTFTRAEMEATFARWSNEWDAGKAGALDEAAILAGLNATLSGPMAFGGPQPGGGRGGPPGAFGGMPFGGGSPMADRLFGSLARQLTMGPMWFLWFLIVFATLGPPVDWAARKVLKGEARERAIRLGALMLRWGLLPLMLAAVCVPLLWFDGTTPGRPPDGMTAIMGVFPDVLLRYHHDWPYFFAYFMAGWGMYSLRRHLDDLGRTWLPCLALGLVAHAVVETLAVGGGFPFQPRPEMAAGQRLGLYSLFAVAASFTSFGFIGFFQRYMNRAGRVSRYFADTAFWLYLLHQELLVRLILPRLTPLGLPWWLQTSLALVCVILVGALTFELLIRRTPLTDLFGPPRPKKPSAPSLPAGAPQTP